MDQSGPASAAPQATQYMVKLKKEVVMTDHIREFSNNHPLGHVVVRTWNPNFLNAYAGLCHCSSVDSGKHRWISGFYVVYVGTFSAEALEQLKQHSNVEYVVENTEDTTCMIATQYLFLDRPC
jgi:hypothetical protein